MISILIPIYAFNAVPLVKALHKQCISSQITFEILAQDDASNSNFNIENAAINHLTHCSFVTLEKNVGHRANRNILASKAKYDYLLFIDGDSTIISDNYIQNYLMNLNSFDVIYGGRVHPAICPSDNQNLRWQYGKFIEDKLAKERMVKPFPNLLFNNTVIKKKVFDAVKFDTYFNTYGHDDTLLSYQLYLTNVSVLHVDNPIKHEDIDTNTAYLNKMKQSLTTLYLLYKEEKISITYSKLLQVIHFLNTYKLSYIISKIYLLLEPKISAHLEGKHPNLWVYNIFRIGFLCSKCTEKES
ncbi:hypothetical protein B0A58_05655 [Flavobacterium branchiophilum NBRC 15030 = ATCC 35035]|uniref:Glycosyl transferase family 2 n=1 Tax=Flavobacterium branchiophilum TaxID=55197 RepID=A0A543G0U6_9FLAO|nr:glycosyltransferase [Flavobacterium branchiophilum]OXA77442.1 hypothetical protein B0A58_05655 [Flavobacterium branchiophilum NBRC 15030 = ATCC 35035]TQM39712.1 glycosyl transferase family 2 [Flavobacterium branchiophilum]GEM55621.1 hypothetical protein FB1_18420 [Flavobacterium branchiophilum NBRC 15030 = ATCC 35035]